MNQSNIQESIKKYEQITGETFYQSPDLSLKVLGDSFMLWKLAIRDGVPYFYIDQTYAKSFSVFVPFIREVCQVAEIKLIVTSTQRPTKIYERKWKMIHLPELDYEYEGRKYHVLKGDIQNLK